MSSLSWGSTLDAASPVRVSLDDGQATTEPVAPRRIRRTLDDAGVALPVPLTPTTSAASFPLGDGEPLRVLPPPSRRLFRVSLDAGQPAFDGRLIRLSLDEGSPIYGRLGDAPLHGRFVRLSLD